MKRTIRQTTSKSGTPNKSKPKAKRTKYDAEQIESKIQKWRSTSSIARPTATKSASYFVNKLWNKVDKSDPDAVRKVLELHADGKNGDASAIYFSSSRFWHVYKLLRDESLSYFFLSLWSVRLEAAHISGNSVLIGDENCSLINFKTKPNNPTVADILYNLDTLRLADWYENYYNLTFGGVKLTDNSEVTRNSRATYNDSGNMDEPTLIEYIGNDIMSVEVQPPDDRDEDFENSSGQIFDLSDRTRPTFLYAEKAEIENTSIGDRVIVVLNVMSDIEYILPLGWTFQPPTHTPSICIPLTFFEDLGVYEQISLAQQFLTFAGDRPLETQNNHTDTSDLVKFKSRKIQTDPVLNIKPDLRSPPLNFDHDFNPLPLNEHQREHNCHCFECNLFLFEFIQEWGMDFDFINQPAELLENWAWGDGINIEWGYFSRTNTNFVERNRLSYLSRESERKNDPSKELYEGLNIIFPTDLNDINSTGKEMGGKLNQLNNNQGGNNNCQHYSLHTITESRAGTRNIDMDRLSQSSPEIDSSSSSSTSSKGGEQPTVRTLTKSARSKSPAKPRTKITRDKSPVKSPIIVIDDEDVPTILTQVPYTGTRSPAIVILDDEGREPIINLASSPIITTQAAPITREIKTNVGRDTSGYFTPPQTSAAVTDDFIKQIYFDNVGVDLERINLDLILQRTTWGGSP